MAVFKDCNQTLPKVQRLEKRIREKTAEKDCYSKFSEKVLKYILFLSGRRDRTCGFGNPFVTSCVSDAQNCGKMQIFHVAERPFTQKVIVGRSKLWYNANFSRGRATLNAKSDRRMLKTVVKCKFLTSPSDP